MPLGAFWSASGSFTTSRVASSYNLIVEQLTADLATQEIVVYNPRDEQVATSHAYFWFD